MQLHQINHIAQICIPVFVLIGIGKGLGHRRLLSEEHCEVINKLVYQLSLPALIFRAVIKQPPSEVFDMTMMGPALLAIVVVLALYLVIARMRHLHGLMASAFVFGTFWANVSYMGFPLSQSAFGDEGLRIAANYNAVVMPIFVTMGIFLISVQQPSEQRHPIIFAKRILLNPIILATLSALLLGAVSPSFPIPNSGFAATSLGIIDHVLIMVGRMGLPLALLSIGAGLKWQGLNGMRTELSLVLFGKLLLLPLLTLLATHGLYPDMNSITRGVTVLMSTTPNAVASYIIGKQCGVDEQFLTAMLVGSTLLSMLAIPFWLYFVL